MKDRLSVVGAILFGLGACFQLVPQISGWDAVLGWPGALLLIAGGACVVVAQHRAAERRTPLALPSADRRGPVWRICLLGAPLVLAGIEIFHPLGSLTSCIQCSAGPASSTLARGGFSHFISSRRQWSVSSPGAITAACRPERPMGVGRAGGGVRLARVLHRARRYSRHLPRLGHWQVAG